MTLLAPEVTEDLVLEGSSEGRVKPLCLWSLKTKS